MEKTDFHPVLFLHCLEQSRIRWTWLNGRDDGFLTPNHGGDASNRAEANIEVQPGFKSSVGMLCLADLSSQYQQHRAEAIRASHRSSEDNRVAHSFRSVERFPRG